MKSTLKLGFLLFVFCILLIFAHLIDNYSPEKKKAKNEVKTTYTMIVNEIEITSKKGSEISKVKIKHDNVYLSSDTKLSISAGDEIQYEYINESSNKIDIKSVTHIDEKKET